ncbi:MAG: methionine--tRNA ligase [Thermoplasmata archaeon]
MARVFIGVAWPYANGPFHLGQLASTYVPADIFARFHRLRGDEVLMVSGSDMHGTPALVSAEREGVSPDELTRRYHGINHRAFDALGISFDTYTTTRTVLHQRTAQEVFLALLEHGFIRRRTTDGAYCPKHARFLPDRYLTGTCPHCGSPTARGDECDRCGRPLEARELGDPKCALCGTPAEFRPTEQFYLELDRLQPRIAEYIARQADWRPGTRKVAENFLHEGLHPTPITRDLDWGIPLPLDGYDSKRLYVWFEALIGYLSAAKEWAVRSGRPEAWRRYWDEGEPARHYYFLGKDNKFHHTILWPGMLLGVGGLHLPDDVAANEWLLIGGGKISKSRSTARDAFHPSLLAEFPPDVIRFYAALLAPENHDTELDWDELEKVRDDVLANQFGNLVQRTLVLVRERHAGRIPTPPEGWRPDLAGGTGAQLAAAHRLITDEYERVHLKAALDRTLDEVRESNRRFHEARPWQATDLDRARILYESVWRLKALATWLAPVLPFSSAEVFRMLGYADPPTGGDWERVLEPPPPGQALGEVHPLFPRASTRAPAAGATPAPVPPAPEGPPTLAVRTGRILRATDHPSADRLVVLEVDVGEGKPRSIVAGIRGAYPLDTLVHRSIVFLSNLAPRTIRGIPSEGMVLAADLGGRPILLVPPEGTSPGEFVPGRSGEDRIITYDEFASFRLAVGTTGGPSSKGGTHVNLGTTSVEVEGSWLAGQVAVVVTRPPDSPVGTLIAFGPGRVVRPMEPVPPGALVR